jgi:hypothetical protein
MAFPFLWTLVSWARLTAKAAIRTACIADPRAALQKRLLKK